MSLSLPPWTHPGLNSTTMKASLLSLAPRAKSSPGTEGHSIDPDEPSPCSPLLTAYFLPGCPQHSSGHMDLSKATRAMGEHVGNMLELQLRGGRPVLPREARPLG